ncbi:MAG: PadR family transcriptional regulator [Actinomycetota bacterium]|nr:PadR family transcriptional regulator [Actinomycetota bacterium]
MPLTTTSYAILGLLDLRDWSAYELAQQAGRSLAFVWPVSESQLYAEPKRLATEGLISVRMASSGPRRSRQVLSITDAGRRELRAWLATEPAPPRIQMEALLRTLLATSGTPADLVMSLDATTAAVAADWDAGLELVRGYLAGDNPFPERLHANLVWMVLVHDLQLLLLDWAEYGRGRVAEWPGDGAAPDDVGLHALVERLARADRQRIIPARPG